MLTIIISNYLILKSSAILWLFANILPTHSNCGVFGFQTLKQKTLNIPGYFCHKPEKDFTWSILICYFPFIHASEMGRKCFEWKGRLHWLTPRISLSVFSQRKLVLFLRSLKQTSRSRSSAWLRSVFPRKMSTGWNSSKRAGNRVEGPKRRL